MDPFTAAASVGLFAIKKISDLWAKDKENIVKGLKSDSLIDYTSVSRVEPIVLIDADCLYLDSLPDVQQSLLSIFAGYYLQAVAISTTVGKISVDRKLDQLNPSRSAGNAAGNVMGWMLAQESYKHCLPTFEKKIALEAINFSDQAEVAKARYEFDKEKYTHQLNKDMFDMETTMQRDQDAAAKFSFDAMKYYVDKEMNQKKFDESIKEAQRQYEMNKDKMGAEAAFRKSQQLLQERGLVLQEQSRQDNLSKSEMSIGRDTLSTIKELTNLSVGKMFTVEITDGLHKASIPIAIRLMASTLPTASLIHILAIGSKDNSFKERWHGFKSGRLEFIKDLVLCQDLISEHRNNLMKDKDGIYTNIMKRASGNKLSTIMSMNPSVATASNLVILSDSTADQLELHINGKLSDFKTREKVFNNSYLMIMVVIEKSWERVTFYHRGIHLPTEVSLRDIKASNKGSGGPDVSEILAAYRQGSNPSL